MHPSGTSVGCLWKLIDLGAREKVKDPYCHIISIEQFAGTACCRVLRCQITVAEGVKNAYGTMHGGFLFHLELSYDVIHQLSWIAGRF